MSNTWRLDHRTARQAERSTAQTPVIMTPADREEFASVEVKFVKGSHFSVKIGDPFFERRILTDEAEKRGLQILGQEKQSREIWGGNFARFKIWRSSCGLLKAATFSGDCYRANVVFWVKKGWSTELDNLYLLCVFLERGNKEIK